MCASPTGQHDQKVISPSSFSGEVFISDTSPLSSPYPTGASIFVSSPFSGRLRHSHSWSNITPKGLKPRSSRALSSVEESGEWAGGDAHTPSSASPKHMVFYKRTRPTELSSPKKPEETLPEAKEQHRTPKRTESQARGESRNRTSSTRTKTQPTSPGKSPQAGQQAEHHQHPLRRCKDSPSRDCLDHNKKNGKAGNPAIRECLQGREIEARGERTRPGRELESVQRWPEGDSQRDRMSPHAGRESQKGAGKDSRQSDANKKAAEDGNMSKDANYRRESLLADKDIWRRKGSVVSPREAKGREGTLSFHSKEINSKGGIVAPISCIPEALQSPKGPLSPGPWKVPSSAKILSEAEVLVYPL